MINTDKREAIFDAISNTLYNLDGTFSFYWFKYYMAKDIQNAWNSAHTMYEEWYKWSNISYLEEYYYWETLARTMEYILRSYTMWHIFYHADNSDSDMAIEITPNTMFLYRNMK